MTQGSGSGAGNVGGNQRIGKKNVIDFNEVREQRLEEKRRRPKADETKKKTK